MLCSDCLVDHPRDARFCSSCGRALGARPARDRPPRATEATAPEDAATPPAETAACRYCGGSRPDDQIVCDSCRALVLSDPELGELLTVPSADPMPPLESAEATRVVPWQEPPDEEGETPPGSDQAGGDDTAPSVPADWNTDVTDGEALPFATVAAADVADPQFESWWVPPVPPPERIPKPSPVVAGVLTESPGIRLAAPVAAGTPALESWWVPARPQMRAGGSAAMAVEAEVPAALTPQDPPPALYIVPPPAMPASDHGPLFDVPIRPGGRKASTAADTFRVSPENSSAALLDPSGQEPASDATAHGPLPQPWWAPRPADVREPAGAPATPPAPTDPPVVDLTPTPAVEPLTAAPPFPSAGPVVAVVRRTDDRPLAAARAGRPATRSAGSAQARLRAARKGQTTRPAFLVAGLLAILLGGSYAVYGYLEIESPTPVAQSQPPPAAPAAGLVSPLAGINAGADATGMGDGEAAITVTVVAPAPVSARGRAAPRERTRRPRTAAATRTPPKPAAARPAAAAAPPVALPPAAPTPSSALPGHVAVLPAASVGGVPNLRVPAETFDAGNVDVKPEVVHRVAPRYPAAAGLNSLEDIVIVRVLVSSSGQPSETRLLRRSKVHASLDEAAMAAVKQWTFTPARKRDRAVACWLNVGVAFRGGPDLESR